MRKIKNEFTRYGDKFTLIKRKNDVVMYKRVDLETGKIVCYEVMIVQHVKESMIGDVKIEGGEKLPSEAQWCMEGWTLMTYKRAKEKFDETIQKVKERKAKRIKMKSN